MKLEPFKIMPNGGQAPRCQRVFSEGHPKAGQQCSLAAVKGYSVCSMHGAGYPKKVARGEKQDPKEAGRAEGLALQKGSSRAELRKMLHGKPMAEIVEEIANLTDPDNTDDELAVARGVLFKHLESSDNMQAGVKELKEMLDSLSELRPRSVEDIAEVQHTIRLVSALHSRLDQWTERLQQAALVVQKLSESRANVRAKSLQVKILEEFGALVLGLREVLWDNIREPALLDSIERDLAARVLTKIPLELKAPDKTLDADPLEVAMRGVVFPDSGSP